MIVGAFFYIFLSSLLIQLGFYFLIFPRLVFFKENNKPNDKANKPVSIIICAHNEASNLAKLIPSLSGQEYVDFEIIVVNDRSTDQTEELLKEFEGKFHRVKQVDVNAVPENINPKKYGLSQGIVTARHELLLLTDADCLPNSRCWISSMTKKFDADTKLVLGYSQYKKSPGLLNLFIRFETLYAGIQYLSLALAGRPYMGVGRNMAYKKSFFLTHKGFQGHFSVTGGDDDLFVNKNAHKKNTKISVGKGSLMVSVPKNSWGSYFRQKQRHLSVGKYYGTTDKLILGLLSLSHIIFWVTFVALAIEGDEPYYLYGGFLIRMIVSGLVFYFAAKRLGDRVNPLYLPLLDFLFVCYYAVIGFSAIITKNIKWS